MMRLIARCTVALLFGMLLIAPRAPSRAPAEIAEPNDNRVGAGRLTGGILTIALEARDVLWYPEGSPGVALPVFAFAEIGQPAKAPGPMLRVRVGTEIHATMRNTLPVTLRLRGFSLREFATDSIVIAPGTTYEVRFRADAPGTYYYWGRTDTFPANAGPGIQRDAVLLGAFIVDSATGPAPNERVLVLSVWSDTSAALGLKPEDADRVMRREIVPRAKWLSAAINGRAWPHTERLSYTAGDSVRYRLINGSRYPHPMHLHGFYFAVNARGDARYDTVYAPSQQWDAVTEWIAAGATMAMTWVPARPGNWLFHCHIVTHISDATRLRPPDHTAGHTSHAESGMAGLVMGIHVAPTPKHGFASDPRPRRKLRLFVTERPNVYGNRPAYSYVLQEGAARPAADSIRIPGSTITLRQNEPSEITVINSAKQSSTIHWHGLELESFYDGVGDWSGWGTRTAPAIAPGDSFVVRLTPPRSGTFIYHTHSDEGTKLVSGMYGAFLVLPANAPTQANEHLLVLNIDGPLDDALPVINGVQQPPPITLRARVPYRFRFINIAPLESRTVQLLAGSAIQLWRPLAKDAADFPTQRAIDQRASVALHPGETYDFEILRERADSLTLRFIAPETIAGRAAFLARATPQTPIPRIVTDIPLVFKP